MNDQAQVQEPNVDGEYPIEPKVAAARIAAFLVSLVAAFLLKTVPVMAGIMPFLQDWLGQILTDILLAGIVGALTWWAGWKATHVQRPQVAGNAVLPIVGEGGTNPNLSPPGSY